MKNLFGWILSAMVVCLFSQSCTDSDLENGDTSPNSGDGKCYMSLRFDVKQSHSSNPSTRTFQPTVLDEDFERNVSDFRIFLVKKDDPDAAVVELKDIPMLDATTTKPFVINKAYTHGYQLYVVANSAGTINLDLSSGKAFRGTYNQVTKEASAKVWKSNHFLMVNVNNEASDFAKYTSGPTKDGGTLKFEHTDPTPNGGVPIEIDDNTEYTYDNPYVVKVNLERLAAKVVVDCSGENFDFSSTTYANKFSDVHVDGVALVNGANCFNLVQQWKIACYQGKKFFCYTWNKKIISQNLLPDGAPYGYPYLWPITPAGDVTTVPSQIYYDRVASFTDFDNKKLQDGASALFVSLDASKKATMYCLENASPLYLDFMNDRAGKSVESYSYGENMLHTGMRNRATGVLFRVRAKVKGDDHNTDGLTPDPDQGKWDTRAATATDDDYRTFYCYAGTVTAYLNELLTTYPSLATSKGLSSTSTVQELRAAGVRVYEDGYMYYMHWITDQNYQYFWNYASDGQFDEAWPFKYLAVLRNTRYEVNVTSVSELGMDLPGRDFSYNQYSKKTTVLEGTNYMLYPVYTIGEKSMEGHMSDAILQKLNNKAI